VSHPARLLLMVCLFLSVSLHAAAFGTEPNEGSAGNWPQWRGHDGLGVSSEPNLPEVWSSNSENIRWRARILGKGNSSPVVSNGRVILTTAYESPKAASWQSLTAIASSALALAYLGTAVAGFLGKLAPKQQKGVSFAKRALTGWFNTLFGCFTSLAFISLALLVTIGRRHCVLVLAKVGLFLSNQGYPDMEHLFSMDAGVRAAVWLTSGGIASLGLAVAVGRLKAHSIWRLIAAGAVLCIAIPFVKFAPKDQWVESIELSEKLAFMLPAMIVACWHLINYLKIEREQPNASPEEQTAAPSDRLTAALNTLKNVKIRWRYKNLWQFGGAVSLSSAALLAALSLLVFIPPNFFEAQLGMQRVVLCFDKETGNLVWEQPAFIAPAERKHSDSTYATPTPATDGSHIIVNFGVGAACLDFRGRILWKKWDPGYLRNSRYGAVASPILTRDKAIIVQEAEEYSDRPTWIAAFDKQTSLTRWRIQPENVRGCYTTPLLYRNGNKEQLIIASLGNVASYDVESGRFQWMERIPTDQLVASMARAGDLLCAGGSTHGQNKTVVLRLVSTNGRTRARKLWQSDLDPPGDCSPVIYAGKLFTLNDKGKMTCFDARTGAVFWNKRVKGGRYLSSLVAGDGKVYACNTKGLTTVIAAEAEFNVIAENDLNGRCYASPAIADGCIFLRVGGYLYCIEKQHP